MHYASVQGQLEVVRELLEAETVDVNASDNDGKTALIYASSIGQPEVVRALLNHSNININAQDKDGWTALSFASAKGNVEVVQGLLSNAKIDVNAAANHGLNATLNMGENAPRRGWTPLTLASANGHLEVGLAIATQSVGSSRLVEDSATQEVNHKFIIDRLIFANPISRWYCCS